MRAVWSLWTQPFRQFEWADERFHLLAWVLSVMTARKHYPDTMLVTDTRGKAVLVDQLGLPFETVSTALDELPEARRDVWVLGKLYAYRAQTAPFVHLDTDVFLWRPLPAELTGAALAAQNPEYIDLGSDSYYRPDDLEHALALTGGWRPDAWTWALQHRTGLAINCGFLAANDTTFIRRFAGDAIRFVEDPANQPAWALLQSLAHDNITLEQYMLGATVEHVRSATPRHEAPEIRYLFSSMAEAFDPTRAQAAGFSHLIGAAKQNRELLARIERRVAREYPHLYQRCLRLLATWKGW